VSQLGIPALTDFVASIGAYLPNVIAAILIFIVAGVVAAAVGGLALAWKAGSDESVAFNKALITTGDYAGRTAEQLADMAEKFGDLGGTTTHGAAAGLAEVAASGKFAGENFDLVSTAAIKMQDATGTAISETVAEFDKLRRDPVNAILELNDKYHFLTQAQFDNIRVLQEQGRQQEAVTAAFRAYANEIDQRTPRLIDSLSTTERLWRGIKDVVGGLASALADVGRQGTTANKVLQSLILASPFGSTYSSLVARGSNGGKADFSNVRDGSDGPAIESEQARARIQFEREGLRFATDRQKLEKDIAEARAQGLKAGVGALEIEKRIAAIRADYAEKNKKSGGRSGASLANAQFRDTLQGFRDEVDRQQNALANAQTLLDEQFKSGLVTAEQYYDRLRSISTESSNAQIAGLEKQIAALKGRTVAGKDAADTERQLGQLEVQLAKVRGDAATRQQVLDLQEKRAIDAKAEAIRAYADALKLANVAVKADFDSRVASISLGRKEFEIQSAINAVLKEKADRLRELALQLQKGQRGQSGGITQDQYDADVNALNEATDARVEIIKDGYRRIDEAQGDWLNGAKRAFADYADAAKDVAGQTYEFFSGMFTGLEDAVVGSLTGTKNAFGDFLDDLYKQALRFSYRQIWRLIFGDMGQGGQQSGGANAGGWLGALISGSSGGSQGSLLDLFSSGSSGFGFADGGYTGPGGRNKVAGVVHAGEYVLSAAATARIGRGALDSMNSGGQGPSGGNTVQQAFYIQGALDGTTREQLARRSGREVETAMRRA
jgi:lambda family phage tail tape measure protein